MSGGRRTWVDAFDRVPVTFSTHDDTAGGETGRARLRLHADPPPGRRPGGALSLVRSVTTRLYAAVSARLRAGVPSTR